MQDSRFAGLRFKLNTDPRFAISRYFPSLGLIAHFSYDRVFQTPSFENILLANSFEVAFINPDFLRLPVEPSQGNYYEAGVSKSFGNNVRVDVNYYLRNVNNYADDDQIENTTDQLSHRISQVHHLRRRSEN